LCDAGKIGRETYLNFAGLDIINAIITNADTNQLKAIKKKGITILKADI
jgi:DeoR family fructose operon transcriptional repressor